MKANSQQSGICVKIKNYQYAVFQDSKSRFKNHNKNPIRIVVDKIGVNGNIEQQILNQNEQFQKQSRRLLEQKIGKISPRTKLRDTSLPNLHLSLNHNNQRQQLTSRSHVFNRFHYDNYQRIPKQQTKKTINSRKKLSNPNHKNIQTVFCENKFPQFVQKTNQKIEQIYKKQQIQAHTENQKFITSHIQRQKLPMKRQQKTTLSNCLKEFATLQKLSIFMQNDQNLRQQFLKYGIERDPSRTLLIDVINHRFSFMKPINRRLRDNIYRSLFKRDDIHQFTKISVQEYILFYQMFIGRDAGVVQTATFVYLLLFGTNPPSFEIGRNIIEQTKGPIHKQRYAIQTLKSFFLNSQLQEVINSIANNEQFTRTIVDLIIQK